MTLGKLPCPLSSGFPICLARMLNLAGSCRVTTIERMTPDHTGRQPGLQAQQILVWVQIGYSLWEPQSSHHTSLSDFSPLQCELGNVIDSSPNSMGVP